MLEHLANLDSVTLGTLVGAGGVITALCTPIIALQRVYKNVRKEKEAETAKILQAAKEADKVIREAMESRIHEIETQFQNLKESVEKDTLHLKETYNSELRVLGNRIEELRQDLNQGHGHLVQLLTTLVDIKKR